MAADTSEPARHCVYLAPWGGDETVVRPSEHSTAPVIVQAPERAHDACHAGEFAICCGERFHETIFQATYTALSSKVTSHTGSSFFSARHSGLGFGVLMVTLADVARAMRILVEREERVFIA